KSSTARVSHEAKARRLLRTHRGPGPGRNPRARSCSHEVRGLHLAPPDTAGAWPQTCRVRARPGPTGLSVARLAELVRERRPCVVLTGAGISTESGIPDFRSP